MTQPKDSDLVVATKLGAISFGQQGIELRTYDDAMRFANSVLQSGMAPASYKTPQAILVAIQMGAELGLSPLRSLSAINVINGRPSLAGEAALALIRASGVLRADPVIDVRGEGDARCGFMRFMRKTAAAPVEVTFSVADAKQAGLWKKAGPWTQHSDSMLRWRAVGTASKLHFSDVLMGLVPMEEVADYEPIRHATVTALPVRERGLDPLLAELPELAEPIEAPTPAEEPAPEEHVLVVPKWNAKGACVGCGRHRNLIEERGHVADCAYADQTEPESPA